MISGRGDEQLISLDGIDEPMLVRYAPRPKPRKVMLQRLRFTQTFEWLALDIIDQPYNSLGYFSIMRYPVSPRDW